MSSEGRSPAAYGMSCVSVTPERGASAFRTPIREQAGSNVSTTTVGNKPRIRVSQPHQALCQAEQAAQPYALAGDHAQAGFGTDHDGWVIVILLRFGQIAFGVGAPGIGEGAPQDAGEFQPVVAVPWQGLTRLSQDQPAPGRTSNPQRPKTQADPDR